MTYTGVIGYRTLLPWDDVKDIPDLPDGTLFSHGPEGHIFTTQVGNGKYEISTRVNLPEEKSQVSWGQPVAKSEVLRHYQVCAGGCFSPVYLGFRLTLCSYII